MSRAPECAVYYSLLKFYLRDCQQCVCIDDVCSSLQIGTSGVPQGSVLELLMFSVYINDFENSNNASFVLHADDMSLFVRGKHMSEV